MFGAALDIAQWGVAHWQDLALVVTGLISAASVVVRMTPTQRDDEWLGKVNKWLAKIALTPKHPPVVKRGVSDADIEKMIELVS